MGGRGRWLDAFYFFLVAIIAFPFPSVRASLITEKAKDCRVPRAGSSWGSGASLGACTQAHTSGLFHCCTAGNFSAALHAFVDRVAGKVA